MSPRFRRYIRYMAKAMLRATEIAKSDMQYARLMSRANKSWYVKHGPV